MPCTLRGRSEGRRCASVTTDGSACVVDAGTSACTIGITSTWDWWLVGLGGAEVEENTVGAIGRESCSETGGACSGKGGGGGRRGRGGEGELVCKPGANGRALVAFSGSLIAAIPSTVAEEDDGGYSGRTETDTNGDGVVGRE